MIGLIASLLITLTDHLGYPEFRSKGVLLVLVGNSLITLAFLLSGNHLGSLISHPVMHIRRFSLVPVAVPLFQSETASVISHGH